MSDSDDDMLEGPAPTETAEAEEDTTLASDDVVTKYQEAAKVANYALEETLKACVAGEPVVKLCKLGDSLVEQRVSKMYNKKVKGRVIEKGLAFPTCISVNECVCHNSPLESDQQQTLVDGDIVKVDIGVHIDGYIAVVAHTVIIGASFSEETPMVEKVGSVFECANVCAQVAHKLIRPGNTNMQVTQALGKVAEQYGVNLCTGTLMHQTKRYIIDGNKVILLREEPEQKVDEQTFETYESYAVDIAVSSGEGKPRELEQRTTVFKRAVDKEYRLKMKASRYVLTEVKHRYATLPFTLRALEDERNARMGVVECLKHDLLHPYPVLFERAGDVVVHVKFTVLLLPNGTVKVTGLPSAPTRTEVELDDDTKAILALSSSTKKKKKKKKKATTEA